MEINETNFPDEVFRSYVKICDSNKDNKLSPDESKSKTSFMLYNKEIKDLKGIEYFPLLKTLYCFGNQLTSLDLSKNTALEELNCYGNQLTKLNVSGCTKLKKLDCSENQLTELNVSGFEELESLSCEDNQLTTLDVSKNAKLNFLCCRHNCFTTLDVSKNGELKTLYCGWNENLTTLNVSGCRKLSSLECNSSQLTTLDISSNTALEKLWCFDNQLTTLDISNNKELKAGENFVCYGNPLTTLDISKVPALKEIAEKGSFHDYLDKYDLYYYEGTSLYLPKKVKLIIVSYAVTYDANGGSGTMEGANVPEGVKLTLPACGFTAPKDKEFDRWDKGNPGEQIEVSSALTIKAVWKYVPHTVTVLGDGKGTATASVPSGIAGTKIALTAIPNAGYSFKGWKVLSGGVTIADDQVFEQIQQSSETGNGNSGNGTGNGNSGNGTGNGNSDNGTGNGNSGNGTGNGNSGNGTGNGNSDNGKGKTDNPVIDSVKEVKKGDVVDDNANNTSYVITSVEKDNPTVAYTLTTDNTDTELDVPSTVTIGGKKYKVTEIKANAFKNNKKLKKITIGKNIEKIGKNAFYGCKNLKTVNIKTVKLTGKTVGKNAFKGIHAKAKVKVPKSKLKSYKKILKARGIKGKKQKITK